MKLYRAGEYLLRHCRIMIDGCRLLPTVRYTGMGAKDKIRATFNKTSLRGCISGMSGDMPSSG
jgi:hypothetical protein